MNIVSAVANLQKAHDYYKEELEDAKAIIKQLVEGPGEIEYIHPFDLYEMIEAHQNVECVTDVFVNKKKDSAVIEIAKTGKKYKQSPLIPAKTKNVV